MVNRAAKRRFRKIVLIIASLVGFIAALIVVYIVVTRLLPLLSNNNYATNSSKIIDPYGKTTNIGELEKKLNEKNLVFSSLDQASMSSVIIGKMPEGPTVYFSESKDVEWQVGALTLILSHLTIDNKKPTFVDLRGTKPIVKF
ncbi:MAG TPA: hypothetical protein VG917_01420 [Patescibacteria group bacterium]|nr:hypothetical protein [Patescibacteria group bacterium]